MANLAFVGVGAFPESDRLRLADDRRTVYRNGVHNRRDLEERDAREAALNDLLAADRRAARHNRYAQVADHGSCGLQMFH